MRTHSLDYALFQQFRRRTSDGNLKHLAAATFDCYPPQLLDVVFMSDIMTDIAAPFNSSFLRS